MTSNEIQIIGTARAQSPLLVFMHEGLGSVSAWRDFPRALCEQVGLAGLVYSRHGYGKSAPFTQPLTTQFMHNAANIELPRILAEHDVRYPLFVGHSDGASIALIYAGSHSPDQPGPVGLIAMAPHLFVEPICTQAIASLKASYETNERLRNGLNRHHKDGHKTFDTWAGAWLDPEFSTWNIEAHVSQVRCPVLAIQGRQDQYGTLAQVQRLSALAGNARHVVLDDCGHSPHVDQRQAVIAQIVHFLDSDLAGP